MELESFLQITHDFPIAGQTDYDITKLFSAPEVLSEVIKRLSSQLSKLGADKIICTDLGGLVLASALAWEMALPVIPARPQGKLPYKIKEFNLNGQSYTIHEDAFCPEDKIILVEDILRKKMIVKSIVNMVRDCFSAEIIGIAGAIKIETTDGEDWPDNVKTFCLGSV